ncbi:hypothetical protein ACOTCT_19625, partial [Achromobacter xylosoxidans]
IRGRLIQVKAVVIGLEYCFLHVDLLLENEICTANARVLASRQADAFRSHTHTYNGTTLIAAGAGSGVNIYGNYSGNTTATGGSETRPENVAFHPRIHA